MTNTVDSNPLAKWLTQGVILAAIPFAAYALSLTFALGRASRLGYPAMLVSPTRPVVLMYLTHIANLAIVFGSLFALATGAYRHQRLRIRLLGTLPVAIGLGIFL